jgi:hypothetical protein
MLATGFDLCQAALCILRCEIAQLSAGAEDIEPTAFTDEHIEACLPHDGLKGRNVMFRWTAEGVPGKFIERNQIDFTRDPTDKFGKAARIVGVIIPASSTYSKVSRRVGRKG